MADGIYGIVYFVGAIYELTPDRKVTHWGFVPWWVFYAAGLAVLMTFPVFVWRHVRWLALTLCFFTAVKALWLFYLQGRRLQAGDPTNLYNWFFAAVAITASLLLLRAGSRPAES